MYNMHYNMTIYLRDLRNYSNDYDHNNRGYEHVVNHVSKTELTNYRFT